MSEKISAARGLSPFQSAESVTNASIVFSRLTPLLDRVTDGKVSEFGRGAGAIPPVMLSKVEASSLFRSPRRGAARNYPGAAEYLEIVL